MAEPRRFIQMVAGPRQVGKTTLVQQVCEGVGLPVQYSSADEPTLRGPEWIAQQWEVARLKQTSLGALLVLDEVQKIPGWSEAVIAAEAAGPLQRCPQRNRRVSR